MSRWQRGHSGAPLGRSSPWARFLLLAAAMSLHGHSHGHLWFDTVSDPVIENDTTLVIEMTASTVSADDGYMLSMRATADHDGER